LHPIPFTAVVLQSLQVAAISTILLFALGYPIAYGMARAPKAWQPMLVMAVVLPFWTSFLIRIYAWINILQRDGLLNDVLVRLHIIDTPAVWLSSDTAVYIGMVYSYLPFMVLPLYASLEKMDESLLEAASDLGCPEWKAFWLITFPLSLPGVAAGALLSIIPIVGEFVIPDLLGGSESQMIGQTLWTEFFSNRDWPVASAIAIALLGLLLVPILFYERPAAAVARRRAGMKRGPSPFNVVSVALGACISLSADRYPRDLLVQCLTACHGLGWLVARMVSRAAERRGDSQRRLDQLSVSPSCRQPPQPCLARWRPSP
jgi:putrescine transport system permease protein